MVIKLTADKPSSISFTISFDSQLKHKVSSRDNLIIVDGICPSHVEPNYIKSANPIVYEQQDDKKGIQFRNIIIVQNQGGRIKADGQEYICGQC